MRFNAECSECGKYWYIKDNGTFSGAYVSAAAGCGPGDAYVFTDAVYAHMICAALNSSPIVEN